MAAMWQIGYEVVRRDPRAVLRSNSFILYAADATAMTQRALRASVSNAKRRAKKRLKTIECDLPRGVSAKIVSVRCIG